jgi:hypothetical protein
MLADEDNDGWVAMSPGAEAGAGADTEDGLSADPRAGAGRPEELYKAYPPFISNETQSENTRFRSNNLQTLLVLLTK